MSFALFRIHVHEGDQDAGVVDVTELVVDTRTKVNHGGGEVHVGVHERGNGDAVLLDFCLEHAVAFLEIQALEEAVVAPAGLSFHFYFFTDFQEPMSLAEVLFEEAHDELTGFVGVFGVDGGGSREVFDAFFIENAVGGDSVK